ncbi:MAG: molybdopterin-guanine dinucleotide biosynthesis protein B [Candidatus Syntrophoarchaeum sp.]|nr:molybdopterin-guanine dinucleotide biosynthesis protein B [Candidatus Syntrophoarchaeum sp.]
MKVISIIGEKKSGKTSLIQYLIAYLKEYGKVGCIKHAHELDLDASKDTDRFFNAGAEVVIGTSEEKTVKICGGKNLKELIEEIADSGVDFVLVEGFKSSNLPKIALNDFSDEEVNNIVKRIDFRGKMSEEMITEIVQLILSLEDYKTFLSL